MLLEKAYSPFHAGISGLTIQAPDYHPPSNLFIIEAADILTSSAGIVLIA